MYDYGFTGFLNGPDPEGNPIDATKTVWCLREDGDPFLCALSLGVPSGTVAKRLDGEVCTWCRVQFVAEVNKREAKMGGDQR